MRFRNGSFAAPCESPKALLTNGVTHHCGDGPGYCDEIETACTSPCGSLLGRARPNNCARLQSNTSPRSADGVGSRPQAINSMGDVVASSQLGSVNGYPVEWKSGTPTLLATSTPGVVGSASGINDLGQIAGASGPSFGSVATIWNRWNSHYPRKPGHYDLQCGKCNQLCRTSCGIQRGEFRFSGAPSDRMEWG